MNKMFGTKYKNPLVVPTASTKVSYVRKQTVPQSLSNKPRIARVKMPTTFVDIFQGKKCFLSPGSSPLRV